MHEQPEDFETPVSPREEVAIPLDGGPLPHDGYEPIRRRRDDEPTDAGAPSRESR